MVVKNFPHRLPPQMKVAPLQPSNFFNQKTFSMPTKIRLQRHGRKGYAFFHIVVADSRSPRDGKFIEKLGVYNPNTQPATIDIDFDSALSWMDKGAQPTDTCRAILSYKGVLYKKHLQGGVKKGAFDQAEADKRFEAWMGDKEGRIGQGAQALLKAKEDAKKEMLAAEEKKKAEIAAKVAAKKAPLAEEVEAVAEAAAAEEAPAETAEAATEAPAAEAEEEPKAE
jgi:small subunit ribosomal protein S16